MISPGAYGQKKITVTVEDRVLVSPDKYFLRIICMTPNILTAAGMENEPYLPKDSIADIVRQIRQVRIIERPASPDEEALRDYVDVLHVEAYGPEAYRELTAKLDRKAVIVVEDYQVENFDQYESALIDKMIERARVMALEEAAESGRELKKYLGYEEVKEEPKTPDNDQPQGGFAVLKQTFIDANYRGYFFNEEDQIVVEKKLRVRFSLK